MVHALLVLAAEAAEEAEPSKTAFYACGGALAVWADGCEGGTNGDSGTDCTIDSVGSRIPLLRDGGCCACHETL